MNRCWGYCRYSMDRPGAKPTPADEKNTIQAQKSLIDKYVKDKLPDSTWMGFFIDPAVSAKIPFMDRPAGKELCKVLEKGDHIVMTHIDRGFRSVLDWAKTIDYWDTKGIRLHGIETGLDPSLPLGRMIMTVLAAVAEFNRRMIGERLSSSICAMKAKHKAQGYWLGNQPPIGFKIVRHGGHKKTLAIDWEVRAVMKEILDLRRGEGCFDHPISSEQVYFHFLRQKRKGWGISKIRQAVKLALKWEEQGLLSPPVASEE